MKKKIAIIGANNFQNRLILKAKSLGYETHVFAWESGDIGERTADYFYPISIIEKEEILQICKKIKPEAVVSIASDLAVLTVNYVARELGLLANPIECDKVATNKYEMRKAFIEAGVPTPKFFKVERDQKLDITLEAGHSWIVKPTDRSGSRGIMKVTMESELQEALRRALEQSFENAAIVEEYIEGKEYSAECISYQGEHHILAITEKFTTGSPHFIEIGHIQPADIEEKIDVDMERFFYKALDALFVKNGASHIEFKIGKDNKPKIIEIGARMGGDCIGSDLVEMSTGNDFVRMVIDVACGRKPMLIRQTRSIPSAIRFIMNEQDCNLLKCISDKISVGRIEIEDQNFVHKVVDSSSRYGYFLATAEKREYLKKYLFE